MTRDVVNALCADFPGATHSNAFGEGHDTWKVGGKVFAAMGAAATGVSLKTPSVADAALLIDLGRATRARYFHRSWVTVPFETDRAELADRIATSYRVIRAGLPKKLQAGLDNP